MKKSFLTVLLAVALIASSCIKNQESEGVKTMRISQAGLLDAVAAATTTSANADAALKAAQTALTTAQIAIQQAASAADVSAKTIANATVTENNRHTAAMNALTESLAAAQSASDKASITQKMATEAATSAYNLKVIANQQTMLDAQIAIDKAKNDKALLDAKLALDAAQKNYDLNIQKQAQDFAASLVTLKTQAQSDLVNGYAAAWSDWTNENTTINNINGNIVRLGFRLSQQIIADSAVVNNAKRTLQGEKVNLDTLNARLTRLTLAVRTTAGIDQTIADYTAQIKTLQLANITLSDKSAIDYTTYTNALNAYNNASSLYTDASTKENTALNNVRNALSNKTAADNILNNATYQSYSYYTTSGYYTTFYSGWYHQVNGSGVGYVAIKDAVTTEKGDTVLTGTNRGQYLSLLDQTDVVKAQDALNAANARIADAKANYDQVYGIWLSAHNVTLAAKTQSDAAYVTYNAAYNTYYYDYNSYNNQLNRNNTTISNLTNAINTLTLRTDVSGKNAVIAAQALVDASKLRIQNYTADYNDALKSFASQQPLNQVGYNNIQAQIDQLKAQLPNEQSKLALYKATLDAWVAKLKTATI